MGRPLRCREPGTYYFVTTRCLESRFFLRPDSELNMLFGYWLARSCARFPRIVMHGALAMSNHIHLLLCDQGGELSRFMEYFLGNLSRGVNRLRRRSGACFHRRYDDGGQVLDAEAAVDRLAYLIANPVVAGLVAHHRDWPGVLLFARAAPAQHTFVTFDEPAWRKSRRLAAGGRVDPEPFHRRASLTLHPLPFAKGESAPSLIGGQAILSLVPGADSCLKEVSRVNPARIDGHQAHPAALAKARALESAERQRRATARLSFLGPQRVLEQPATTRPVVTARSPRPPCHTSDARLWSLFVEGVRLFQRWYHKAAHAFRNRQHAISFPPFSLHPGGAPAT